MLWPDLLRPAFAQKRLCRGHIFALLVEISVAEAAPLGLGEHAQSVHNTVLAVSFL
jgi:hypothetical protein